MTNKLTNAMALTTAIEILSTDSQHAEVVEKLQKMLVQTQKKNSSERKLTATQTENIALKEAIICSLELGKKYTITDIMKTCKEVEGLSNQRVSAIVRQLKDSGELVREEIKRKAYFSLSEEV